MSEVHVVLANVKRLRHLRKRCQHYTSHYDGNLSMETHHTSPQVTGVEQHTDVRKGDGSKSVFNFDITKLRGGSHQT
ncbi:hypothetical protein BKA82DRAFT_1000417 [Pisolithus tinctorius]|nr:hypothetical protein BKA82DRAFT_1000417 [Pisolithus tinctorius]